MGTLINNILSHSHWCSLYWVSRLLATKQRLKIVRSNFCLGSDIFRSHCYDLRIISLNGIGRVLFLLKFNVFICASQAKQHFTSHWSCFLLFGYGGLWPSSKG